MKTLIELYDERPIENVLATEVFRPQRTIFLCPPEVAQNKNIQNKMREYFVRRGVEAELIFLESSLYNAAKLERQLCGIADKYPECIIDVTGGTDAALFASGKFCAASNIPAFTYSWKSKSFFSIHEAHFGDELKCEIQHEVEDCFVMAGGAMREGRVDNSVLDRYLDSIDAFFALYMKHRNDWTSAVSYIQRASQVEKGEYIPLEVDAPYTVICERGNRINAPEKVLYDLEKLGYVSGVSIGDRVRFSFKDRQIRTWLRDIGSVLELYVYKTCLDTGLFNDVRTSAVVDWEGDFQRDNVTNEIDVMAMQGIVPVFISCKTCEVSTEALNELAILRDRFGGKAAKAAIVTAHHCRNITRHRALELGIDVIDLEDLEDKRIGEQIKSMMNRD